jgi:hypothetical protein
LAALILAFFSLCSTSLVVIRVFPVIYAPPYATERAMGDNLPMAEKGPMGSAPNLKG